MLPSELKAGDFSSYPPQARQVAVEHLLLLQKLPLAFAVVLLHEVIVYDWKFPAERHNLDGQFAWLSGLSDADFAKLMQGFNSLRLSAEIERINWVSNPSDSVEKLTALLWSTHQMDTFRAVADQYAGQLNHVLPPQKPSQPRLGIVVLGEGVHQSTYPLFRKLRPSGAHLTNVDPENGLKILLSEAERRIKSSTGMPEGFQHWYIDGSVPPLPAPGAMTQVTYDGLNSARHELLVKAQKAIQSGSMGPEALRSLLAQMRPEDIGLSGAGDRAVLNHFQVSLLTQGAGTQIFATTFVQWTARECLRRAQPETIMLRFAPRQRQQPMNELLSGAKGGAQDPAGSLVDADMGAYYTWLNMQRLSGAEEARFVVWFQDQKEALVIGPGVPKGVTSSSAMDMQKVLGIWA